MGSGKKTTGQELAVGYVSLTTDGSKIAEEVEKEIGVAAERGGKTGAKKGGKALGEGLGKAAAAVGAAAGTQLTVGIHAAMSKVDLPGSIQAQMGGTAEEAKAVAEAAGSAYTAGWGESLDEVGQSAGVVAGALKELGQTGDLEKLTIRTTAMAKTFGQDALSMTTAAKKMVQTGMSGNLDEALDLMTAGMQGNQQLTTDLVDSMTEYSTEFRELGLNGADSIGLMNQAMRAGARDGDIVADGLKEYTLIAKDMGKEATKAYTAIGLDAGKMQAAIAKGGPGAKEALIETLNALRKIEDPVAKSSAALGIFGSKFEDMQSALFALDPTTAVASLGEVSGAAQSVVDNSAGFDQTIRQLARSLYEGLGSALTPLIPQIKDFAKYALEFLRWLEQNPMVTTTIIGIGAAFATAAAGMWLWNAAALANPVTWILLAIIAVVGLLVLAIWKIAENWDAIVAYIQGTPLFKWGQEFGRMFREIWADAERGALNMANAIIRGINGIIRALNIASGGLAALTGGSIRIGGNLQEVPGLATGGTITSPGTVLVGENGPELLDLGRGASVIPLDHPAAYGSGGGSGPHITYKVYNPVAEPTSVTVGKTASLTGAMLSV